MRPRPPPARELVDAHDATHDDDPAAHADRDADAVIGAAHDQPDPAHHRRADAHADCDDARRSDDHADLPHHAGPESDTDVDSDGLTDVLHRADTDADARPTAVIQLPPLGLPAGR